MECTAGGKSPMHMESLGLHPLSPCSSVESILTQGGQLHTVVYSLCFPFTGAHVARAGIPFIPANPRLHPMSRRESGTE